MGARVERVVALVGSAGTVRMAVKLVRQLDRGDHSCLFVVYHRSPSVRFDLGWFLAADSDYKAHEARTGLSIEPNRVYYPRDAHDIVVRGSSLHVEPPRRRYRPNLDRFLASLGRSHGANVVVGLVSGLGTDGVKGLEKIQETGGRVLALRPEDAPFPDLVQRALDADVVDETLTEAAFTRRLARLVQGPSRPRRTQ